jgi:hypothetical protein
MPAATMRSTVGAIDTPPSSLTADAPASARNRPALRTASFGETWKVRNGMSAITSARALPRATAAVWRSMSSRVTGSVLS